MKIHETELAASPIREWLWFVAVLLVGGVIAYPMMFGFIRIGLLGEDDLVALMWGYARRSTELATQLGKVVADPNVSSIS